MRLTPDNNRGFDSDLRQSPDNNRSYDAKIAKIRQYTEIILRRLLEYPCDKNIEIGNTRTTEKLDKKGYVEEFFRSSLEVIRKLENERTHTKYRKLANEEEYIMRQHGREEVLNRRIDIQRLLFYAPYYIVILIAFFPGSIRKTNYSLSGSLYLKRSPSPSI